MNCSVKSSRGTHISFQFCVMLGVLMVFAFIANPEATDQLEPVIWYINGHPAILCFFICVVSLLLMFVKKQVLVDSNAFLLSLRIITCLMPLLYISDAESFSSHYPIVILTVIAYLLGRRKTHYSEKESRALLNVLICFGLLLCIQVAWTFTLIDVPFFDLSYKTYMTIPIAASNVIASYIVPILCCLFPLKIKKVIKIPLLLVFFVSLLLTKSRGGIITLFITYLFYKLFIQYKFKSIAAFGVLAMLSIITILLFSIPEVQLFFMGNSDTLSANSISSGRLEIFGKEFSRALEHPIFGNGMVFNQKTSVDGAHNLIIELFVQSGLIGLFLYLTPMFNVFRRARTHLYSPTTTSWYLLTVAVFINGFVEVNFFNWCIDLIFWFSCGLIMNITHGPSVPIKNI